MNKTLRAFTRLRLCGMVLLTVFVSFFPLIMKLHTPLNILHIGQHEYMAFRRQLLKAENAANKEALPPFPSSSLLSPHFEPFSPTHSPLFSPSKSPSNLPPTSSYSSPSPSPSNNVFIPSPSSHSPSPLPNQQGNTNSSKLMHHSMILWSIGGFSLLILVCVTIFACFQSRKLVTVRPWTTGMSGQLQKAFVTGVPILKRAELEAACEDFSNIIGSLSDGTVYKGTLSSGVEIAVASSAVTTFQNWSKNMEAQFRKKIETLSRVNHKNFMNLVGYCEDNDPFTRMMVFEYAPNGTLFEHLHIREAEELEWKKRVRIAMGIAYCLEHMHELNPPIVLRNLQSSCIYLTEDYAAKISDLSFWNHMVAKRKCSATTHPLETPSTHTKDNVYSFGIILFELVTGRLPYVLVDWAAEHVRKGKPLSDVMIPTLNSLQEDEIEKWSEVIKSCVNPDPEKRSSMREVTKRLKEITAMGNDEANPKSSPLLWAELEIMSIDSS